METKFRLGKPAMTTDFTSNRARLLSEYRNDGCRCLAAIGARLHSRFKKGQSGNPRARPKKNLAALRVGGAQLARIRHAITALFWRGSEDSQIQGGQPVCAMLGDRFLTGRIARTKRVTDVLPGSHRNPGSDPVVSTEKQGVLDGLGHRQRGPASAPTARRWCLRPRNHRQTLREMLVPLAEEGAKGRGFDPALPRGRIAR